MEINTGNTAWLLLSSALVLLMTPGLALFYGGLNRSKGVLNMMMMSFSASGSSPSCGCIYGFTLAFGTNGSAGLNNVIGSFSQYFGTSTSSIGEEWLFFGRQHRHPDLRLHGLPDDVRHHHRRPDQRRASPTG